MRKKYIAPYVTTLILCSGDILTDSPVDINAGDWVIGEAPIFD